MYVLGLLVYSAGWGGWLEVLSGALLGIGSSSFRLVQGFILIT